MRRWLILAAVAAQVLTLAFMAGQREWVVRTGERVLVRTAPIDPNDPMRGEYARLDYEISSVPKSLCRDGVAGWFDDNTIYSREIRDRRVFAVLERDELGVASITSLTDREPSSGLFLRGRAEWIDTHAIRVRYGIEAFFMEQGRAIEFERKARGEMLGVPVNAEVAVSPGGLAVLRDYHWESLGIALRFQRVELPLGAGQAGARNRQALVGAIVTLKNHGDEPVAIVDLPGGLSFRLVAAERWGDGMHVPVDRDRAPPAPRAADVVLLQPGESRDIPLDFRRPEWFVQKRSNPGEAAQVPVSLETMSEAWGAWFRIEYVPPSREACAGLPHAEAIRHARLRSRSFNPSGGAD